VGYDVRPEVLVEALEHHVIDRAVTREELYAESEIVVIAAHLEPTLAELARLRVEPQDHPGLIVDIGSVKGVIARAGRASATSWPLTRWPAPSAQGPGLR